MQPRLSLLAGLILLSTSTNVFSTYAYGRAPQCNYVPSRGELQRDWDEVIDDKRRVLDEGIDRLNQIRAKLNSDRAAMGGAGTAGLLILRESTDLISLISGAFDAGGTAVQKATLKYLGKIRDKADSAKHDEKQLLATETRSLVDELPTFLPGIRLAREVRDWDAARAEISRQLDGIERTIRRLDQKLLALGGPERAMSVDTLLSKAQARAQQCQIKPEAAAVEKRRLSPTAPSNPGDRSFERVRPGDDSACSVLGTCDE